MFGGDIVYKIKKSVFYSNNGEFGLFYLNFRTIVEALEFIQEIKKELPDIEIIEYNRKYWWQKNKENRDLCYLKQKIRNIPMGLSTTMWYLYYNLEFRCDISNLKINNISKLDLIKKVAIRLDFCMLSTSFCLKNACDDFFITYMDPKIDNNWVKFSLVKLNQIK